VPNHRLSLLPVLVLVLAYFALPLRAHEILPTVANLEFDRDAGLYRMDIELNLEALIAEVEPELADTNDSVNVVRYDSLRGMTPQELSAEFEGFRQTFLDGLNIRIDNQLNIPSIENVIIPDVGNFELPRVSVLELTGTLPDGAETYQWQWIEDFGTISLRADNPSSRESYVALLDPGDASAVLEIDNLRSRSAVEITLDYIRIGFVHILPKGIDHILFVVGIFLLSPLWRPILWQVTAFTLAHTTTLGLGAAGYITVPASIVEPLIAASICYVAIENIWRPTLSTWRPFIVFGFGLLHGLGFAGILYEIGIPEDQFLLSLLAFNVGVELGQLTVIAICFGLVGIWFGKKEWYRRVITIPASAAIAVVGAYWVVERTLL